MEGPGFSDSHSYLAYPQEDEKKRFGGQSKPGNPSHARHVSPVTSKRLPRLSWVVHGEAHIEDLPREDARGVLQSEGAHRAICGPGAWPFWRFQVQGRIGQLLATGDMYDKTQVFLNIP